MIKAIWTIGQSPRESIPHMGPGDTLLRQRNSQDRGKIIVSPSRISYRVNPGIEGVSDKKLAFAPGGRVCCSGAEGKRGAKA